MENQIIEAQVVQPKKHYIRNFIKREPIYALFIGFLILSFGTVTICRAYDFALQTYFENALKKSAENVQTSYESCEALRQTYLEYKSDSQIKPTGIDVCNVF